ncbi:hypothetical protein SAY87_013018 [Trapa incisa]|uniref:F-box domain-containing protein n=1 Tax=Trapa incisa TaxID=236973 RepID=A0AAN7QFL4_9MYRT|nr:hypothetical protein SAY87_013018 [Trapa incisa]
MDSPSVRVDCFDRLPDELLLLILNRVRDAKSLTRCLAVSKRFGLLVLHADAVFLPVQRRPASPAPKRGLEFPLNFLAKTARFIRRIITSKMESSGCCEDECSYYDPQEILKPFTEIHSLDIEVPMCGRGVGLKNSDGFLLKWAADFGTSLNSCTILGANSLEFMGRRHESSEPQEEEKAESSEPTAILSEKELNLRVVWIISCLIAAASRHALLKDLIEENTKLEEVEISDAAKQGKLWMGKEQVDEVRKSAKIGTKSGSESMPLERSVVPELKMKLWFVPQMKLPETGYVMNGATLVLIRPAKDTKHQSIKDEEDSYVHDWFGEGRREEDGGDNRDRDRAFSEAMREMRKIMKGKRNFTTMEMNSF